jgi:hypothetical protein
MLGLCGLLSGCGISDLVGDLKDLQDEFDDPDGGYDFEGQEGDGGAPQRQLDVEQITRTLDNQGGQLATEAGGIDVPAGALEGETQITVAEVSAQNVSAKLPSVLKAVAPAVAFTPHGQTFAKPVTLSLFHEGGGQNLVVLRLDDESDMQWERVDATFAAGVAYVTSTHFSIYNVSECDPSADADGTCAGLVQGAIAVADLATDDFRDFEPPRDFGEPGSGATSGESGDDPTDDEPCTFETVCQVITSCRPLRGEADGQDPVKPMPGAEGSCMVIEEDFCWEECVTGGSAVLPGDCKHLPDHLEPGCQLVPSEGACPLEVRCGASGGTIQLPDAGVDPT